MSYHDHNFGTGRAEQPTLTIKAPSSLTMDGFGQLAGLQPSMWLQDEVHFYDKASINELSKRIDLKIDPADVRRLFIRQEQGSVVLGIEFSSHAREQVFLNTRGAERLNAASESLIRRAGYPFFDKEPEAATPPSPGLSFTRFIEVANEVDKMHEHAAREPRTVEQRLAEIKMRHDPKAWAAKVEDAPAAPKKPGR